MCADDHARCSWCVWLCDFCTSHRAYFVIPSDSPNGSYDSISPQEVLEVVELALSSQRQRALGSSDALPVVEEAEVFTGDTEATLLQGYGSYRSGTSGNPTGW